MKKVSVLIVTFSVFLSAILTFQPVFANESKKESNLLETQLAAVDKEEDKNPIKINKREYTLEAYSSVPIEYELEGEGNLQFKSLDEAIVTVNNAGLMSSVSSGTTEVVVSFENKEGIHEEKVKVNVLEDKGKISFNKEKFYLIRDLYFDIDYKLEGGIKAHEIIWESSNPSVARVENGRVYGQSIGKTLITASARNASASMEVHVTVPLKGMAFNPEKIEMYLGEEVDIPSLVYVPYDTTSSKSANISLVDGDILSIENNKIIAKQVGTGIIRAQINEIVADLEVTVLPKKNQRGADLLELLVESKDEKQMTLHIPDLSIYGDSNLFAISLPSEETIEFIEDKDTADIFLVLEDKFYSNNMERIDELVISKEIMEKMNKKEINFHLLNQGNIPKAVYTFKNSMASDINLKYSLDMIDDHDELFALTKTKAYHLQFMNKNGFPAGTELKIPAQLLGNNYKQLHFVYHLEDYELQDTQQELMIDSSDYLNVNVSHDDYIITLTKVASTDDSKIIITLSIILFITLLSGFGFYYYKSHNKKKV